jgi:demethylmenaquinone methyltransferase / 2-methoxy-6-polyprenyl-1,4-benzoquinol methylase
MLYSLTEGRLSKRFPPMEALSAEGQVEVVREIFTTVHGRYDFLNHFLSFRRDVGWRAFAVEKMRFGATGRLLDVATGTADLAIAAARRHPSIDVTGIDFAAPMLEVGRGKVRDAGLEGRVHLIHGDALSLPFPDASFDVAAIAFGMRNIPDKKAALKEMARVTAPGGQVMVLEMTFAPAPTFRVLYGFYLGRVLPRLARMFIREPAGYHYLGDSIRHFPSPAGLGSVMEQAGLENVVFHGMTFGAAYLHIGRVKIAAVPRGISRGE